MSRIEERYAPKAIEGKATPLPGSDQGWREWLGQYCRLEHPLAAHHERVWEWGEALTPGVRPSALIEAWNRGAGKSTTIEHLVVRSAVRASRSFFLYVCHTQKAANRHVTSIANTMERVGIQRALNQYGLARGWSAEKLRCANGFNVLAFGLDAGGRGVKLDDLRPDGIILDDIDELGDSLYMIGRKIETITSTVIPSGTNDLAVIFVQNPISANSVMSQVLDGRAEMLHDRLDVRPVPAIYDFAYKATVSETGKRRFVITAGRPSWEGKPLSVCQAEIDASGITAFLRECQHDVKRTGTYFTDFDDRKHVVLPFEIPRHWRWLAGFDWGYANPSCFLLAAIDERGNVVVVDEIYAPRLTNPEQAKLVVKKLEWYGVNPRQMVAADPGMWQKKGRQNDQIGRADVEDFRAAGLNYVQANNQRIHGWNNMRRYLQEATFEKVKGKLVETPALRIFAGRCTNLIRTLPLMVHDVTVPEDLDTDGEDHACDALRYLLNVRPRPSGPDPSKSAPYVDEFVKLVRESEHKHLRL